MTYNIRSVKVPGIDALNHVIRNSNGVVSVVEHPDGSVNIIDSRGREIYDGYDWRAAAEAVGKMLKLEKNNQTH